MQRIVGRLATPLALLPALLAALVLSGCQGTLGLEPALTAASTSAEDGTEEETTAEGRRHVGKPYQIAGRWYHPKEDEDYDETGLASWYGAEFHGSRTANGERFDPSMLTGAHPTLPLPSFVRVTNLKNGKAAVVRINDRGPFKRGRIVDVSRAVAEKLEFRRAGSAKVRVEYLGPAPIGGGDEETLVAEAKYGTGGGSEGRGLGRFLPSFGLGGSDENDSDGGEVEVRLASAEPTGRSGRGAGLPGVSAPTAVVTPPTPEPAAVASTAAVPVETASAYQAPADDDIDALIAMNSEPTATEPPATPAAAPARAPEPLRAAAPEEAEARIMGAHDLFLAIDSSSGGSGELNGIKPAE